MPQRGQHLAVAVSVRVPTTQPGSIIAFKSWDHYIPVPVVYAFGYTDEETQSARGVASSVEEFRIVPYRHILPELQFVFNFFFETQEGISGPCASL